MRKFLSLFVAALFAFAANAAVINITNETPDALRLALNDANDGDEIVMAAGTYVESNGDYIAFAGKHVTVKAAEGAEVLIQPQVPVQVTEGGTAHFVNVKFDASRLQELATWYEHLMYPADAADNNIILDGCEFYGFNFNKSMLYCSSSNKLAAITINNCYIHDCMKSILFDENTEVAINAQVTNSTFANISTNTESYWAGIIDLRAASANLLVDHCTFYNVIPMNTDYSCVSKITLANGVTSNCIFMLPTAQDGIRAMRGVTANNCITFNYLKDGGTGIHSSVTQNNCQQVDPAFVDPDNGNFTLGEGSPALTMNDGQPIGDPRWVPAPAPALENGFYLVGTINSWAPSAEYHLVGNPDNPAEFMVSATLAEGDEIKVCNLVDGTATAWYPSGDNYVVDANHAGEKTLYFQPDYKEDWAAFGGYFYIAPNEEPQPIVSEWAEISFAEAAAADDIAEEASYTVPGTEFALTLHDAGNKMVIDGNDCRFGTAEAYTMYNFRIKSGGASSSTKNYFTLNIPEAGTLRLAPRTGSNSATDRALVITQGEDTLYNAVVQESQAIEITEGEQTVKVYPYVEVAVAAGEVRVSYTAGMNFYAFAFKAGDEPQPVEHTYTVAGSSADLFGTAWDPTNVANDMALQEDGTYKWEKTEITLPEGAIEFKVCQNHAWTNCWPAENYSMPIPEAGVYTITITYNPEGNVVAGDAVKTGDAVVDPVVSIAGGMNGWSTTADLMTLAEDKQTASLTLNLTAQTYEFKVVLNGGDWRSNAHEFTRENATAAEMTGNLDNMHLVADMDGDYVFTWTFATNTLVITYPSAGPEPLTIPEDAPVPTVAEEDVMAIYCNHYANNNANFGISGWAGAYQTLVLNEINVGYWTGMTWECIIDPAHTDDPHDFSAYKNIHVDLWAPIPASIQLTAEAVAGGNYKDGQVVEMQQGWNSMDFVVAEWPGNYDFKNLKCFVFEHYTIEGQPFAFANLYFYGKEEQGIDNTAVDVKAVKTIINGQLFIEKNGKLYNAQGAIVR